MLFKKLLWKVVDRIGIGDYLAAINRRLENFTRPRTRVLYSIISIHPWPAQDSRTTGTVPVHCQGTSGTWLSFLGVVYINSSQNSEILKSNLLAKIQSRKGILMYDPCFLGSAGSHMWDRTTLSYIFDHRSDDRIVRSYHRSTRSYARVYNIGLYYTPLTPVYRSDII